MKARYYYTSVIDGTRYAFLTGPFMSHEEALDDLARAKRVAYERDPFAVFYLFGTCKAPPGYDKPGILERKGENDG